MEEFKAKLAELQPLMGLNDPDSEKRKEELMDWLEAHKTAETEPMAKEFIEYGLDGAINELTAIRDQLRAEQYKVLPLSYIAKEYFGKSAAWLQQRINGYKVRNKVYTLNQEQKATFNAAVQDIAQKIGSIRIA